MSHVPSEALGPPAKPRRRWALLLAAVSPSRLVRNVTLRRVFLAAPVLLVVVGILLAVPFLQADPGETRRFYEGTAALARQRGDAATAGVCLDRLTLLKNRADLTSPEFDYQLAKLSLELGQVERAEVLLEGVALEDRAVHAPAHLMRAALLLRKAEDREPTRADQIRAERHLRYALSLDPEMTQAHEILGKIALNGGDLAHAEGHLQRAARANPMLNYQVASILYRQGHSQSAEFWARRAKDYAKQLCEKDPDNHTARMMWASSEDMLRNHEAARTILTRGLARVNLRDFHRLLAESYLVESAALTKAGDSDPTARLTLLEHALQHDPNSPALAEQIAQILKGGGAGAEQFRAQLRGLLVAGEAVTTAHMLLGYDAWEHGRADEARMHWERALEANPKSAVAANNLAWSLATGTEPDLLRALKLADLALEFNPSEPSLLGTRGRILARLKRWKEALSALEAALTGVPDSRDLHADLAATYAALGSPELAEQHRRLAEALPRSAKAPTP